MYKILILILLVSSKFATAQTVLLTDYYYNTTVSYNFIRKVFVLNDGYLLSGQFKDSLLLNSTIVSKGQSDIYLLKLDNNKNVVWKRYFGTKKNDAVNYVNLFNGNLLAGCFLSDSITIDTIKIIQNSLISKANNFIATFDTSNGNLLLADTGFIIPRNCNTIIDSNLFYGNTHLYKIDKNLNEIKVDSGIYKYAGYAGVTNGLNNIYVNGGYDNFNTPLIDSCSIVGAGKVPNNYGNAFFVKKDKKTFKNIWARAIESVSTYIGPSFNIGKLIVDKNDNVFVLGQYIDCKIIFHDSTIIPDGGGTFSTFVAKYDSSGNLIWARRLCSGSFADADIDSLGDLYIACGQHSPLPYAGVTSGNLTNSLSVFKLGNNNTELYALPVPNGNFAIAVGQLMVFAPDSFLLAGSIITDTFTVDTVTFKTIGSTPATPKSIFLTLKVNNVPANNTAFNLLKIPITIYPNPVTAILNIKSNLPLQQVSIVTLTGSILFTTHGNVAQLSTQSLPLGIYMLKTITTNGIVQYTKFIKNN